MMAHANSSNDRERCQELQFSKRDHAALQYAVGEEAAVGRVVFVIVKDPRMEKEA